MYSPGTNFVTSKMYLGIYKTEQSKNKTNQNKQNNIFISSKIYVQMNSSGTATDDLDLRPKLCQSLKCIKSVSYLSV